MRLLVLGSGSIVATQRHAFSGLLVEVDDEPILFDIGPAALYKLIRSGKDPNRIGNLFITHYHLDHVTDLLPFAMSRPFDPVTGDAAEPNPLAIYGPNGLSELLKGLFENIPQFRYMSQTFKCFDYLLLKETMEGVVKETAKWRVTCAPVKHYDGVAYRLDTRLASLAYSGDTVPDENLIKLAHEVDLLIHECSFPEGHLLGLHTTPWDLGKLARRTGAKRLLVTHLYPICEGREKEIIHDIRQNYNGEITLAEDLMSLNV